MCLELDTNLSTNLTACNKACLLLDRNMSTARHFWLNVNYLIDLKHSTLKAMCEDTGLSYGAIRALKYRDSYPEVPEALKIARWLEVTLEDLCRPFRFR